LTTPVSALATHRGAIPRSVPQALGGYYYLENKIRSRFQAKCIRPKVASPLLKGETVEVRRLTPGEAC